VVDSANQIKLYPITDEYQRVTNHNLSVSNHPIIHTVKDYFGNTTGFFTLVSPHNELIIDNMMEVYMDSPKQIEVQADLKSQWDELRSDQTQLLFHDFLKAERASCELEVLNATKEIVNNDQNLFLTIQNLSNYICDNFTYKKGVTTIETSVDELWGLKAGVCQDFAHLLLYMLRQMGIPARYISGYICPGSSEWRGEGATHAWAEAWLPEIGWFGIDPTNKCLATDRHVKLAMGRNFSDCTPVKGTFKGAIEHKLEVTVKFGQNAFTDAQLENPKPTFVSGNVVQETSPQNSYIAYMQMQQQQ
jgi:transglutaminase-like putative cysteine protease